MQIYYLLLFDYSEPEIPNFALIWKANYIWFLNLTWFNCYFIFSKSIIWYLIIWIFVQMLKKTSLNDMLFDNIRKSSIWTNIIW